MNYLVISPYYPQIQQLPLNLANKGITVLGLAKSRNEQLDEPCARSLTEYFRVENMEDLDKGSATAFLFYKHGPIDRISQWSLLNWMCGTS